MYSCMGFTLQGFWCSGLHGMLPWQTQPVPASSKINAPLDKSVFISQSDASVKTCLRKSKKHFTVSTVREERQNTREKQCCRHKGPRRRRCSRHQSRATPVAHGDHGEQLAFSFNPWRTMLEQVSKLQSVEDRTLQVETPWRKLCRQPAQEQIFWQEQWPWKCAHTGTGFLVRTAACGGPQWSSPFLKDCTQWNTPILG